MPELTALEYQAVLADLSARSHLLRPVPDDRNLPQRLLDKGASNFNSWVDLGLGLYNLGRDKADGFFAAHPYLGAIAKPFLIQSDFGAGALNSVLRVIPGTISAISHPLRALEGVANAIDSVLLDDTPALEHLRNARTSLQKMTAREIAFKAGGVTADIAMIVVPEAKLGSLRAASFEARALEVSAIDVAKTDALAAERNLVLAKPGDPNFIGPLLPEAAVNSAKYPEAARHILDAQAAGHPITLTIDRSGALSNRAASLKGYDKVPGMQLDEYPPAMFREGGLGASVRPISPSDNMGSGASLGNQIRRLPDGTKVRIIVK